MAFKEFIESQGYELLGEPKVGGFAIVVKVRHVKNNYIRAFKILKEAVFNQESKAYKDFVKEFETLRKLGDGNHPNIVRVYQRHLINNQAIVEMEYVEGEDLRNYLVANDNFLSVEEVSRLVEQIGSALSYCHRNGVKHNDIHSGNIIRKENGEFVLLDFGLAFLGDRVERSSLTRYGAPEYKAPEKWKNEKDELTEQSDIYSFGVVMFGYLAGRVPFCGDPNLNSTARNYELMKAHLQETPPRIFDLRKRYYEQAHPGETYEQDYPQWLEDVILKCLEKDPKKRFKDGKELYERIVEHLGEERSVYNAAEYLKLKRLYDELLSEKQKIEKEYDELNRRLNELKFCVNCGIKAESPRARFCRICGKKFN